MKKVLTLTIAFLFIMTAMSVLFIVPAAAAEVDVTWEMGYIGANNQSDATRRQAFFAGGSYSCSSFFTIEKAGTNVYFTDYNNSFGGADLNYSSASAFVFSVWSSADAATATFISGGTGGTAPNNANDPLVDYSDTVIPGGRTYTYVTKTDNEVLRVCYRSDQAATSDTTDAAFTNYPTIYTGEIVVPETTVPETTKAPDTTKAPETTKAPDTTKAPETTKAPDTTAAAPETTAAPASEGCGSTMAFAGVLTVLISVGAVISARRSGKE